MNWRFILPILAACLSAPVAAQQEGARVLTEHAETALVAEQAGFAPGETLWFALHQQLEDGWHVYWKNPGDSGLPLTLDWTLPDGFVAGDPVYPTPERIPVGPIANYGFHGEPVFLLPVTASTAVEPGTEVAIALRATWLICEEICVPEDGTFSLSLPVAADPEPALDGAVLAARARREAPAPFDGDATFQASADALVLALPAPEGVGKDAYFFSEREGLVEPAAAQSVSVKDGMLTIAMKPGFGYRPEAIDRLTGVLASSDRRPSRGFRLEAAPETAAASTAVAAGKTVQSSVGPGGVAFLFAAALFGGVLLNIMPCVFPVIFIKAASLMNSVHADRGAVRRHGLLFAAGVLASFALLGGALLALRAGGAQLGWGFHLQSPMVVALSAYVLFLVGLNLSGVFEVGESLQGAGGGLAARGGDWGAFFTGVLAVVVAAPCIGPLLTAPVGAAAFLPPAFGMGIFLLMGLGLALPYLALSFSPTLGRFLPRPGPWMAVFKQALAFPVFAAAAYFLWVLAQQAGSEGLAKALGGAVMLALAAWLFQLSKGDGRRAVAIRAAAAVAAAMAIAPIVRFEPAQGGVAVAGESRGKHGALASMSFDPAMIPAYRAEGRGVFVDFTAAWCVTCQFNKLTVFSKQSLADAFQERDVVVMVADWTRRDPEITRALEEFGANGVPLYVYYPPEGAPRVLGLPISERSVVEAIDDRDAYAKRR